ncbi:MAG: hypothetical protein C4567_14870 [Deltaproteobacteria bacterium]|nr:MAG: hypothetical protein C4567_14870 [Deltaproteobacteria bacterium]
MTIKITSLTATWYEWPNGAGFSPEHLHAIGKEVQTTASKLRRASFRGQGMQSQVAGASWEQLRNFIYQGREA